ncbi:MAG: hypothetical protein V3V01_04520 [Acidimicrobiales bacterium]
MKESFDTSDGRPGEWSGREEAPPLGRTLSDDDGLWSSPDLWVKPDIKPSGWAERSTSAWISDSAKPVQPDSAVVLETTSTSSPRSTATRRLFTLAVAVVAVLGGATVIASGMSDDATDLEVVTAASAVSSSEEVAGQPAPLIPTTAELATIPPTIEPAITVVEAADPGPAIDLSGIDLPTIPVVPAPTTLAPKPEPVVTPTPPLPPVVVDPVVATLAVARDAHPVLFEQSEAELRALLDQACGAASLSNALRLANSESKGDNPALQAALSFWITTGAAVSCPGLQ